MRIPLKRLLPAIMAFFIAVVSSGCALSLKREIRTEDAADNEVSGTYSLILYGGRHGNDLETVAILDREDDSYTIVPYTPDFDYRIIKHLPAKEALVYSYRFVGFHPSFSRAQLARIVNSSGAVIGYEIRPLYMRFTYGLADVLDISYWRKGEEVFVKMKLKQSIEMMIMDGGDGRGHR
jgi:hypothetical protein